MNNLEAYKGVFVFAQQVDNVISNIAYELIGKGKELAKDLGRRSGIKRVPYRAVHTCNRICYQRVQTGNLPDRCNCNRS